MALDDRKEGMTMRLYAPGTGLPRTLVLVIAFALAAAGRANAASITIEGTTLGCFGSGCSTFGSPVTGYNIQFTGTTFGTTTTAAGSASDILLGSFARGSLETASGSFALQVTFLVPTGIGGSPSAFTAVITTNINGSAPGVFDFAQSWTTFNYSNATGFGSFQFMVSNDPSVPKNSSSIPIYGAIQNATFTATTQPVPVPEPTSLLLVATGLLSAGILRRRLRR